MALPKFNRGTKSAPPATQSAPEPEEAEAQPETEPEAKPATPASTLTVDEAW